MSILRAAAAGILAALLLPLPALTQEAPRKPPSEEEARALFEWFDGLGFPDVRGKPWVRVIEEYEGDDRKHESSGFLLSEGKETFRVLHPTPVEIEYHREGKGPLPRARASFERADLLATVKAVVLGREGLPDPGARENVPDLPWGAFLGWNHRLGMFVLARAVHAAGEREWALRLLACYDRERWRQLDEGGISTRILLERDIGEGLVSDLLESFGGADPWTEDAPLTPRPTLLDRARRIVRILPGTGSSSKARAMVPVLERMVREDADHRPPEGFPDRCSPDAAAREWVFRLRDQQGSFF